MIPLNYLMLIINTCIIPIIMHGIEVYGSSTDLLKLDKYLKKIINIITFKKYTNIQLKDIYKTHQIMSITKHCRLRPSILAHNMIHNDV